MNLLLAAAAQPMPLLDIIDLKWLLASEGVHLHVERLQNDPDYAARVLDAADRSPTEAVRKAARRVRAGLAVPR